MRFLANACLLLVFSFWAIVLVPQTSSIPAGAAIGTQDIPSHTPDPFEATVIQTEPTPSHAMGKEYSLIVPATRIHYPQGVPSWEIPKGYPTRVISQLDGFTPGPVALDKWGGRMDRSAAATGYFYTKKIDGRWWAIDPQGHYYIHKALVELGVGSSPTAKSSFSKLYRDKPDWIAKTDEMMRQSGFNGAGAWSDVETIRQSPQQRDHPIAYTVNLDVMSSYGKSRHGLHTVPGHAGYLGNVIFAFDPDFESFANRYVKEKLAPFVHDPALFGYFSDNEMPIARNNLDRYLALPHDEPGYQAAKKWLDERHASVPTDSLRIEFLTYEVDRYASIVSAAIRRFDPYHMYLGCRFNAEALLESEVFAAMGKYADAISANYYYINNAPSSWIAWTPDVDQISAWERVAHKPIIITEFYAKGRDSGMPNITGGGWLVATQKERGEYYQNFTLALLQSKDAIGWHWFKYQDNDPNDASAELSNRDANKGILNIRYQPYQPLLGAMKDVNNNVYALADYFDQRDK